MEMTLLLDSFYSFLVSELFKKKKRDLLGVQVFLSKIVLH